MPPVTYDPSASYTTGDVIAYANSWWVAQQDTTPGQDPTGSPGKWLVLDLEATALKAAHTQAALDDKVDRAGAATHLWVGLQSEYDAIATKDDGTDYAIKA